MWTSLFYPLLVLYTNVVFFILDFSMIPSLSTCNKNIGQFKVSICGQLYSECHIMSHSVLTEACLPMCITPLWAVLDHLWARTVLMPCAQMAWVSYRALWCTLYFFFGGGCRISVDAYLISVNLQGWLFVIFVSCNFRLLVKIWLKNPFVVI